jgi:hypothetical protein
MRGASVEPKEDGRLLVWVSLAILLFVVVDALHKR